MASTSIPYLRTDGGSTEHGFYFSVTTAPADLIPKYLEFHGKYGPKSSNIGFISKFENYTIPFASYVPERRTWGWKAERLEALVETLRTT